MSINSSHLPYHLSSDQSEQIKFLADVLGIERSMLISAGQKEIEAFCAVILYRHLSQRQRIDAMASIRNINNRRLMGKLVELALQTTFVNPEWGIWSLSNEELQDFHELHKQIDHVASLAGISISGLGIKDIVKEAWNRRRLSRGGWVTLVIWGLVYANKAQVDKASKEIDRRSKTEMKTSPVY